MNYARIWAIGISADGSTLALTAPSDGGVHKPGSVHVYVRSGSTWTRQARLTAVDVPGDRAFGQDVALSADGNILVTASDFHNTQGFTRSGAGYVFVRTNGVWNRVQKLVPAIGLDNDGVGRELAMTPDGSVIAMGGPRPGAGVPGSVVIFERQGSTNTWVEHPTRVLANEAVESSGYFGSAVAFSNDGNLMAVGDHSFRNQNNDRTGAIYVFQRLSGPGATWVRRTRVIPSDSQNNAQPADYFVALSANGLTMAAGAWLNDGGPGLTDSGTAYTFDIGDELSIAEHPQPSGACAFAGASLSVSISPATGSLAPPDYQWQIEDSTTPGGWKNISNGLLSVEGQPYAQVVGATSPTIQFMSFSRRYEAARGVRVVVTNACGSLTSNAATLVVCAADFNCSGVIDADDIFAFLEQWFLGNFAQANFNGDPFLNADDIFAFLIAWFAAGPGSTCP